MAFVSYAIWCFISVISFLLDLVPVPLSVLIGCLAGMIASNLVIYAMIRTGFNKRFNDPSLTLLQMIVATCWVMAVLYYGDSIRSVILLLFLVIFIFGLFRLTVRQFLGLSLLAVFSYALVLLLLYKNKPDAINVRIDLLNLVVLAMVLPWFSVVGGYIRNLRATIYNAFSTMERMTDNVHDVIFTMDMNQRYTYVSPSVRMLRGYESREVMQQLPVDAITPSSLSLAMGTLDDIMRMEEEGREVPKSKTLKLEMKRKDGSTLWTEVKFSFIRDKQNKPVGILGVARDITERLRAEEESREAELKFRTIFDSASDGIILVSTGDKRFRSVNRKICEMLGYTDGELLTMSVQDIHKPDVMPLISDQFNKLQKKEISVAKNVPLLRKDGTRFIAEVSAEPLMYKGEEHMVGSFRDISERVRADEALKEAELKFRTIFETASDGILLARKSDRKFISANESMCEMMRYNEDELLELGLHDIHSKGYRPYMEDQLKNLEMEKRLFLKDIPLIKKDGTIFFADINSSLITIDGKESILGLFRDITERKRTEDDLRRSEKLYLELSITDDLTRLYNVRHFYVQLEKEIERANRYHQPLTLLLLDLDKFKDYNDAYGHIGGDYVLSRIGQIVKRCLRETDSAYRYGGEEFTIILPMTTGHEGIVTAQRIQAELKREIFTPAPDRKMNITVSIGLSQYRFKEGIKEFIHRVDMRMYKAKENGRDQICHELYSM